MENKISLVYENGEFTVYINDEVVTVNKYMDNAIEKFTQTVHNNATPESIKWESIEEDLKGIDLKDLELHTELQEVTL